MAEQKTTPTGEDAHDMLNTIGDASKRQDCLALLAMMREITQVEPKVWAGSMVGFGDHHYKYASGREGDTFVVGFAPRKQALTLYVLSGFEGQEQLLEKLGRYTTGKGCLYVKRLADVDLPTLRQLIERSVKHTLAS